jgi:hypothetical protein
MGSSLVKRVWSAGLLLAFLALLAAAFSLRKESYLLNKNVRLVFMRVLKYKEYSLHRGLTYRLQFNPDDYRVTVRSPGPDPAWREVVVFSYEDTVKPEGPGLILTIHRGKVVTYEYLDRRKIVKPYVILYFVSAKHPSPRRGIMFNESGEWRAL